MFCTYSDKYMLYFNLPTCLEINLIIVKNKLKILSVYVCLQTLFWRFDLITITVIWIYWTMNYL